MSKTDSAKSDSKAKSTEARKVGNPQSADLLTLKRRLQPASPAANEFLKQLKVGAKVRVNYLITEGNKKRIQVFEGTVIAIRSPNTPDGTFTVRKLSFGVGVERTYPIHSPNIAKVEVVSHGKVRRSKLYYLRDALTQKDSKLRTKYLSQKGASGKEANNFGTEQLDDQFEGRSNDFEAEHGYSAGEENNQSKADTTVRI